jgi:serine protease Do
MIAGLKVGETARVKVFRDGKSKTFAVKLAKRSNEKLTSRKAPSKNEEEELGIRVTNLTSEMAQRFNLGETAGVVVVGVESDSKGSEAGVRVGDIIKEINHQEIETVEDYTAAVQKIKAGESVNLFIWRKNAGFLIIKFNK